MSATLAKSSPGNKMTQSGNSEIKRALLFMPDISGFTVFVNDTEINHSQHIIRELLEILIDSNSLKMQINLNRYCSSVTPGLTGVVAD